MTGRMLTRRGLLNAAPAVGVALAGRPAAAQDAAAPDTPRSGRGDLPDCASAPSLRDTPLRELAAAKGVAIGSTMLVERLDPNHPGFAPRFTDLVVRECQIVSTENDFKVHRMVDLEQDGSPRPVIRWRGADRFVDYFRKRDVAVHGHTLIWNRVPDRHFFRTLSAQDGRAFLEWYVETVVARFAGRVTSWDVVNEPTVPGRFPDKAYREGPYLTAYGGPAYIVEAFKRARAADPAAKLVLNDFGFVWGARWTNRIRSNFLRILDDALDAGAPIDAVGMQSHLRMYDHLAQDQLLSFVDQLRARDVEVMVTELDVAEKPSDLSIDERDERMADFVAAFLEPLVLGYGVRTIITWGLSDLHTYEYREAVRKMADPEFRPRPSWYDTDLRPKPVRDRVAALLAAA